MLTFLSNSPRLSSPRVSSHFLRARCCAQSAPAAATDATTANLHLLRQQLSLLSADAVLVPNTDPHNSEYPPSAYERRSFISNFTGSAGTALVTQSAAYLWTDGRYFTQASQELDQNWTLMRSGLPDTPTITKFLEQEGGVLAIDPFLHSAKSVADMQDALQKSNGKVLKLRENVVDKVWGNARPDLPCGEVRLHQLEYAGKSVGEKLQLLRDKMSDGETAKWVLCSSLDEVCWLYNIRGCDLPITPVVISYALVGEKEAFLYVESRKISTEVRTFLVGQGIEIRDYERILDDLTDIAGKSEKIWYDPASTSAALADAIGELAVQEVTPVLMEKAVKNEVELDGMRNAHLRDGVALSSFLCWLEDYVRAGNEISEVDAAEKLRQFRAEQDGFMGVSFDTIAGFGANGAVIHYKPTPEKCATISESKVLLIDSGGQYYDGTTDVTRTMHLGRSASAHEKACFTRVLRGHIALDRATFPDGTTGMMLDVLARVPLWTAGLDYRHGTGHGVGACLNVHEGPQSISPRISSNKVALKKGMIVSNEPGYYEDGSFGIRIENLVAVVDKSTAHRFGDKDYLGFEKLTYVPLDRGMIDFDLLTKEEIQWVDDYHQEVWDKLSPMVDDKRVREWLLENTRPLLTH